MSLLNHYLYGTNSNDYGTIHGISWSIKRHFCFWFYVNGITCRFSIISLVCINTR